MLAPSLGRGCRAQRDGVGFLFWRRSRFLFAFPIGERRCVEKSGVLVYRRFEMHFLALFHTAPLSNLRPFGAPPSIGRRECPREPLPLEEAGERSEAELAFFLGGGG